ncbi:GntR family transcriptional regulator [Paenibacillus sp. MBLB4367]|uniref:GntR family transcriptional regulator n=1 Tax=Paenibacillus sp. MBLB4367 TaxID=3384767 RepID=UPI00390814B2
MNLSVSLTSGEPIYLQIKEQIKNQILAGQLQEGDPLPSIRNLAQTLKISVITTKRAYDDLEQEGLVASVSGKGTFVSGTNKHSIREIKFRELEEQIKSIVTQSRALGLKRNEVMQLFDIFYGEERD